MTQPPRVSDVPREQAQIARDGFVKGAPGIVQGGPQARPVRDPLGAGRSQQAPTSGGLGRLSIFWNLSTSGAAATDRVYCPGWTGTNEDSSNGRITADPGGTVYVNYPGIYAYSLAMKATGVQSAAATSSQRALCEIYEPFTTYFDCGCRGGDAGSGSDLPSTSRTYFNPGLGSGGSGIAVALSWANLDLVNVTSLFVQFDVQQIA